MPEARLEICMLAWTCSEAFRCISNLGSEFSERWKPKIAHVAVMVGIPGSHKRPTNFQEFCSFPGDFSE